VNLWNDAHITVPQKGNRLQTQKMIRARRMDILAHWRNGLYYNNCCRHNVADHARALLNFMCFSLG